MKVVQISQRSNASSADDPAHDVSIFSIAIDSATPFWLEHSIRGGHAERGGCTMLALHERDAWRGDWRADVTKAGGAWAIPILEEGLRTDKTQAAIDAIPAQAQAPGCASSLAALLHQHQMPSSARTSLTMPQNDTTQMALRRYGIPAAYTGTYATRAHR